MKKLKLKMSLSMVKKRIQDSGIEIFAEKRLTDNSGTQIVTIFGHVVNVYDNGSSFPRVTTQRK